MQYCLLNKNHKLNSLIFKIYLMLIYSFRWIHSVYLPIFMMISSNGNKFRVTGLLCGEFTGHRSPHKCQWRGALIFSLICVWISSWVNNRKAGDLRRHRARYYVTVTIFFCSLDTRTVLRELRCQWSNLEDLTQGWGLLKFHAIISLIAKFSILQKYMLDSSNHIHIWQMLPQLSCGDTCQTWMRYSRGNQYFDKIWKITELRKLA